MSKVKILKAVVKKMLLIVGSAAFSSMLPLLSIAMGVAILTIIGAEALAIEVARLLPAAVVICLVYYTINGTFKMISVD